MITLLWCYVKKAMYDFFPRKVHVVIGTFEVKNEALCYSVKKLHGLGYA